MCDKNDPTNNSYIVSLQESAKRAFRPLKQKKDPVSIEMLLELCNMHVGNNDLLVVRDLSMILLSFARFLRFDEVSSLLCSVHLYYCRSSSDHAFSIPCH
jgi:hypothetical protein